MFVRRIGELTGENAVVKGENFVSHRIVLARDGVGVSVHLTHTKKGSKRKLQYKNHLESIYLIDGKAKLHDLKNGTIEDVFPGTAIALDQHDPIIFEAITDLVLFCVFCPALHGPEVHDADGSYPLL